MRKCGSPVSFLERENCCEAVQRKRGSNSMDSLSCLLALHIEIVINLVAHNEDTWKCYFLSHELQSHALCQV